MKWFIFFGVIFIIIITGCTKNTEFSEDCVEGVTCNVLDVNQSFSVDRSSDVEKIEVIHFHGTNQCFSCRTVGAFAEKTVNTYYTGLLDSGKMTFASINTELPENKDLAIKYGVSGSSLWIGTYINGEFHKEENVNVWYKVNDEDDYLLYLKGVLDKRLAGDLS